MPDREPLKIDTSQYLSPKPHDMASVSPPRTPLHISTTKDGCSKHPDWSMGSSTTSPDYFQRPTSSMSNGTDYSDDSLYSGSRMSRPSEDGSCTSPESDIAEPFQFPSFSKCKGKALYRDELAHGVLALNEHLNENLRHKKKKDALWTKDQSAHLWATYLLYLQDPTVTPFRIGASAVPPQGIVNRVSRETQRSWKGPKTIVLRRSTRLETPAARGEAFENDKSGSITPTAEYPKVYAPWPHSSNATRHKLRELCRNQDSTTLRQHRHLQSRSPTPFTKPYNSRVRSAEPPVLSFNTQDFSLSLSTSTAESMQPDGPLAKLASVAESVETPIASTFPSVEESKPYSFGKSRGFAITHEDEAPPRNRRLGSPFSRTYGPSSSKNLNIFDRPSPHHTQSDTATRPYLRSPVQFDESRSLNGTQKRRAQHSLEEELSPNGAVLRPSILDEQLFGGPLQSNQRRVRSRGFSLGDEAFRLPNESQSRVSGPFRKSPTAPNLSSAIGFEAEAESVAGPSINPPQLLPSVTFDSPRLGSPFSESGPSATFPRRLFPDTTATIRRSAFATMHQTRRSIESFDFGEGPSLHSRLSQLDQRLKEIRERDPAARRSLR